MDLKKFTKTTTERFVKIEDEMSQLIGLVGTLAEVINFLVKNFPKTDVSANQQKSTKDQDSTKHKKCISNYNGLKN